MNWGTKLVICMFCFMSFIVILGVLMFNSKTDALVDNDYYEKGLDYNKEYAGKAQVITDNATPDVSMDQYHIILSFKKSAIGKLKLMRLADKKMDRMISFQTDKNLKVKIPATQLAKGRWKLILSWNSVQKTYSFEQEIDIK
jgi:hypothetical protein